MSLSYKLSLKLVPPLYSLLARALFASCRLREEGGGYRDEVVGAGRPFIALFWHYSVLCSLMMTEHTPAVAMVSASRDAEYVSRLLRRHGVDTVRGSRGKGGLKALREMMRQMTEEGKNAVIVADGSQGPPLVLQAGAILLASRTGAPILPVAWGMKHYWAFNSWDRMILPRPGTTIRVCFGAPLLIPSHLKAADLEVRRLEVEERLLALYRQAWGAGIERH
ncbi:lysophospholipid acyltransferase family protein [Desulfobacterota bacterium M19]